MGNKEAKSKENAPVVGIKFEDLVDNSERYDFPDTSNGIKAIAGTDKKLQSDIEKYASETRIMVHKDLLDLCSSFLEHKKKYGTAKEQTLYGEEEEGQTKNAEWFVQRLIHKRPRCFAGADDKTYTRSSKIEKGKVWASVGTPKETVVRLTDYLSYDEIAVSALLGISSPSIFINTGNRKNMAQPMAPGTFIPFGIYCALVGARFERPEVMESQHMLIQEKYNTKENGYGPDADPQNAATDKLRMWAKFYGVGDGKAFYFPTYSDVVKECKQGAGKDKYLKVGDNYLNVPVYLKRMRITIEAFLYEASYRAREYGKPAYCHIVGLGLGEWEISEAQGAMIVDLYADVIKQNEFSNIAALNFSWFRDDITTCGGVKDGGEVNSAKGAATKIYFSKRDPADPLPAEHQDKLLVAQYAWDGNAWPGNEFWWPGRSQWDASGDPAAACCSTIAELQNSYINPLVLKNIQVLQGPAPSTPLVESRSESVSDGKKKRSGSTWRR